MVLSMELQSGREPLRAGMIELNRTIGDEDAVLVTLLGIARDAGDCGNTVATSGLVATCFFELSPML